jgi:putative glutamine amidotransferase
VPGPRVVVTVSDPARAVNPDVAAARNALYADAIARHGADAVVVSPATAAATRRDALATMTGLLLSGGGDIDPARYGGAPGNATDADPARDDLDADAWAAASSRALPVLGICRGLQAINVFSGGRLLGDVAGHRPAAGAPAPLKHPLRVKPGTRLARILFPTNSRGGVLEVNSSHHQAVRLEDLASGLVVAGTSSSPAGELVEALETESRAGRFVLGVQFHPERRESTPAAFERLLAVFVDACRGPATSR